MGKFLRPQEESRMHQYNKENKMKYLKIEKALYQGDLKVQLIFNDGVSVSMDFGKWIQNNPHPQYNRYLNEKLFKKFYIDDMGNIAWGKNRDLYFPIDKLHDGLLFAES